MASRGRARTAAPWTHPARAGGDAGCGPAGGGRCRRLGRHSRARLLRLSTRRDRPSGLERLAHKAEHSGVQLPHELAKVLHLARAGSVRAHALCRHHCLAQRVWQIQLRQMGWGQCDELCPQRLQRVRVPFPLTFAWLGLNVSGGYGGGVGGPRDVVGALSLGSSRGRVPRVWPRHRLLLNGRMLMHSPLSCHHRHRALGTIIVH